MARCNALTIEDGLHRTAHTRTQLSVSGILEFHLLVLAGGLLILLHLLWRKHRGLKLPPGPKGLPFIGHLRRLRHRSLQALSTKYGPIMFLRFGMLPAVVVSSPEMAKAVLKTHDLIFSSRPYRLVGEHVAYNFKDILFAPNGEHWRKMRKVCLIELFTAKRIDSFLWVRMEEVSALISHLLKASERNEVVIVRRFLSGFTHNVMTRILMSKAFFGPQCVPVDAKVQAFVETAEEIVKLTSAFNVSEYLPSGLRWVDPNIARAKKLHLQLDKFVQEIIDEHRLVNEKDHRKTNDFVDILLSYFDEEGCEQDDIVKALTTELISAGSDTSTTVMEWVLAELLRNPHVLSKAQGELDSVVGRDRMVQMSDVPKLNYLQAIIKETFRLHPPSSLLLHMSTHKCKVAGYDIPKGASLFVNVYAIGRDPSVWENPTQFLPERFEGSSSSIDIKGHNFELLPFGSGRRACPGMTLALATVQLAISNLIHAFNWSSAHGQHDHHPMEEVSGAINWMATPLQAQVVPRLNSL